MSIYTPGRRRAILLLLLTSMLLVTLDLRGNQIFDSARSGFDKVLQPFETAADVVTRPVEDAWRGITEYRDLADENERLRDQLDAQSADIVSAQAAIFEIRELQRLNDLPAISDYETAVAAVVGEGPTNLDQVIEINKGTNAGIDIGMVVVSAAGLVGKVIAPVEPDRARIMLITDARYSVDVKIVPGKPVPETTTTTTTPGTTTTLTPITVPGQTTVPAGSVPTGTSAPAVVDTTTTTAAPVVETTTTVPVVAPEVAATTTTIDVDIVRETGGFEGQGDGELPAVQYLDNTPTLGSFVDGDLVFTSGSQESLAPADIPVGRVVNVIDQSTSAGPILQIEPFADLETLHYVRVVLYLPATEAETGD